MLYRMVDKGGCKKGLKAPEGSPKGGCKEGLKAKPKKKLVLKQTKPLVVKPKRKLVLEPQPEYAKKKSQQPAQQAKVIAPKSRVASNEYVLMSGYKGMPKVRNVEGGGRMTIAGGIKFKAEPTKGDKIKLTLLGENDRFLIGTNKLEKTKLMKTTQFEKLVNNTGMGGRFVPYAEWVKQNTSK